MNRKRQTRKGEEARSHLPSLRANVSSLIIQIQRFSDLVLTLGEARGGSGLENLVEEVYVLPETPTFLATNNPNFRREEVAGHTGYRAGLLETEYP